jgi:hypothetical protein
MAGRKLSIGQAVRIHVGRDNATEPRYASFVSYEGREGTVTALADMTGRDADAPQLYEVHLTMHGNVILTVPRDALVAIRD